MNRPFLLLIVPLFLICILAKAVEPNASDPTNPFAGKILRVNMAGGEEFVLENAKLTTLIGDEFFFVGTGVKDGPRQTSWCVGMEVHLHLSSVSSYLSMTAEQWKDKQRVTSTPAAGPPFVPIKPQARLTPIPAPPKPAAVPTPVPPTQPTNPTTPLAGIVPTNDATPLKALQAERVKMLKQLVDIQVAQYRVGTVDFNQLSSAQNEWCDAQLDSMGEPEKRVALLTKQIDMANDILKIVQARFEAGTVTESDICRVKSLHLGLKIKLLREQDGKRPPDSTGKQSSS